MQHVGMYIPLTLCFRLDREMERGINCVSIYLSIYLSACPCVSIPVAKQKTPTRGMYVPRLRTESYDV